MATPRCGSKVVKGYGAIFGLALENDARRVDLPAFGTPTMPTSAIKRNSKRNSRSVTGSPFSAIRGAWLRELVNREFLSKFPVLNTEILGAILKLKTVKQPYFTGDS